MNYDAEIQKLKDCGLPRYPLMLLVTYLKAQFGPQPADPPQPFKHEKVSNFLHIPLKLEKFIAFGMLICLDGFLHVFTILPLRAFLSLFQPKCQNRQHDIFKISLVAIVCFVLSYFDASQLYHSIKGQSTLKLYVLFNVFEVMDKLFSSFGLDILDSFFSKSLADAQRKLPPILHFFLAVLYIFIHSLILLYQVITLNVAVNSYNNAVLTLLVSNQFMELKSAVFKKFERENLYQLSCADAIERFQLLIFAFIIAWRNLGELGFGWRPWDWWTVLMGSELWDRVVIPLAWIYGSEIVVDGLKHAFITKFNHIAPNSYELFSSSLADDLFQAQSSSPEIPSLMDQSPIISRKIGFSTLPLCCLLISILVRSNPFIWWFPIVFLTLLLVKCSTGILLHNTAARIHAPPKNSQLKTD